MDTEKKKDEGKLAGEVLITALAGGFWLKDNFGAILVIALGVMLAMALMR